MPASRHAAPERSGIGRGWMIGLVVGFLVLVGAGYGCYRYGLGMIADEVRQDLAGHPVVLEHLGEILDLSIDVAGTGALPGEEDIAFRVRGSKGSGVLQATVITGEDGYEHVVRGTLTLANGETVDLFPTAGAEPPPGTDAVRPDPKTRDVALVGV